MANNKRGGWYGPRPFGSPSPPYRKYDSSNSMGKERISESELLKQLKEIKEILPESQYELFPIDTMNVLNRNEGDKRLDEQKISEEGEIVVNGGFYYGTMANVPIIRKGKIESQGIDKTQKRGVAAVLKDGTIVIDSLDKKQEDILDLIGGGGQLIRGGKEVTGEELYKVQRFDQRAKNEDGLTADQFRRTHHMVIGIRNGQAYAIHAKARNGREMQKELLQAGFSSVVKLDGGSGFFINDGKKKWVIMKDEKTKKEKLIEVSPKARPTNPTGLKIKTRIMP